MISILEVGLINAALATGLAMVVWLATRVWRHPVFVHTLWIVVLLKLITPPVVNVPWKFSELKSSSQQSGAVFDVAAMVPADQPVAFSPIDTNERPIFEQASISPAPIETAPNIINETDESVSLAATRNEAVRLPSHEQEGQSAYSQIIWTTAVIGIWLTGTIVYVFVSAVRLAQFHRALSQATPACEEIHRLAAELARRFGVRRYQLRVTEGQLSPLVWPVGTPTILMPRRLVAELSREEVETLLAHEFAHLYRRDHWLRWLELGVTGAYWWHPVVWWAKAAIQRAEEKACDAWVVSGLPDVSAQYASALFKALQFASADRQTTPVMASALGGQDLKERIEHIMNATWKPRLFLPVRLMVLAATMLILPLSLRAVGEADKATQQDAAATVNTEDESTATDEATAATTGEAIDPLGETSDSNVAESTDAATSDALDTGHAPGEAPATTTDNPFAAQPSVRARPGMQPRRVPVPADPYHIAPGDVLFVSVAASGAGSLEFDHDFVVEPSGSVALGPQFGRVKIGGLSLEEAEKAVAAHLKQTLRDPMVQITIGGWRNDVRQSRPRLVDSNGHPMRFPWERPDVSPSGLTTPEVKPSLGTASRDEVAALQEYVRFLEEHFKKKDALFRVAARGGSADARDIAAYELVTARGQLALAEGRRDEAIRLFEEAQKVAEQAMISVTAANQAGMTTDNTVLQAARNLTEIKRRLIDLRQPAPASTATSAAAAGPSRNAIVQLAASTHAPAVSESIGVLKKIVQRAAQDHKRLQELAKRNAVSATEVAQAQSEYEISVERLKQGERALKYYRAQVKVAEADYAALSEARTQAPGAVSDSDLRRAQLAVELARAKLEELAE
jgi:beta-lactamase regulating signal transducer with metallopeptidase domain